MTLVSEFRFTVQEIVYEKKNNQAHDTINITPGLQNPYSIADQITLPLILAGQATLNFRHI